MVEKVNRKSMLIRESGRSTDFITPSFGYGCLYNCSYCYMKRHKAEGLTIAKNDGEILTAINNHVMWAEVEKPNQTHEEFITYDISCNEDFALHHKYHNWQYIFDFFKTHPRAMASFATKYVCEEFLNYNPEKKVRIRFSLMPEKIRAIVEPNTSTIEERIKAIPKFINAGYDVHINFSPVIVYDGWELDYLNLFESLSHLKGLDVRAEVIFLTHNEAKHKSNILKKLPGEELLWTPDIQESKISEYGGKNIRYKRHLKSVFIEDFKYIHDLIIPWNTIRYIF